MSKRTQWVALVLVFGLGLGVGLTVYQLPPAQAQADKAAAAGRYTVVDTDATNLLVTDNHTNTFHYYTVDRDQPPGSDLKLRGSVDLSQVGQPVIKPKLHKE